MTRVIVTPAYSWNSRDCLWSQGHCPPLQQQQVGTRPTEDGRAGAWTGRTRGRRRCCECRQRRCGRRGCHRRWWCHGHRRDTLIGGSTSTGAATGTGRRPQVLAAPHKTGGAHRYWRRHR